MTAPVGIEFAKQPTLVGPKRFGAGLTSPADCNEYRSPVAKLVAMPLMQLIVKVLHRRTAVALLVQSQHPQKTSAAAARRLANPPVDQP